MTSVHFSTDIPCLINATLIEVLRSILINNEDEHFLTVVVFLNVESQAELGPKPTFATCIRK